MKFEDKCNEILNEAILSKGLINAMGKPMRIKTFCDCGYMLLSYPGRYAKCPLCGRTIVKKVENSQPLPSPEVNPGDQTENGKVVCVDDEDIERK